MQIPDGMMVRTPDKQIWYLRGGKKYRLYSERAAESWGLTIVDVPAVDAPKAANPLGFRDGTLIHNIADGKMYLISASKRRQIVSPDVLTRFGWRFSDFMYVSDREASLHADGPVLR